MTTQVTYRHPNGRMETLPLSEPLHARFATWGTKVLAITTDDAPITRKAPTTEGTFGPYNTQAFPVPGKNVPTESPTAMRVRWETDKAIRAISRNAERRVNVPSADTIKRRAQRDQASGIGLRTGTLMQDRPGISREGWASLAGMTTIVPADGTLSDWECPSLIPGRWVDNGATHSTPCGPDGAMHHEYATPDQPVPESVRPMRTLPGGMFGPVLPKVPVARVKVRPAQRRMPMGQHGPILPEVFEIECPDLPYADPMAVSLGWTTSVGRRNVITGRDSDVRIVNGENVRYLRPSADGKTLKTLPVDESPVMVPRCVVTLKIAGKRATVRMAPADWHGFRTLVDAASESIDNRRKRENARQADKSADRKMARAEASARRKAEREAFKARLVRQSTMTTFYVPTGAPTIDAAALAAGRAMAQA